MLKTCDACACAVIAHCTDSEDFPHSLLDVCRLTEQLKEEGISIIDITRLTRRYTGRPTQVAKIRCTEVSAKQLLDTKVVVKNKVCTVEKQRPVRVVRCYNCQRLGHLAIHCNNIRRCEICSELHAAHEKCTGNVVCGNCLGNHPSSSSICPVYQERYENLAK